MEPPWDRPDGCLQQMRRLKSTLAGCTARRVSISLVLLASAAFLALFWCPLSFSPGGFYGGDQQRVNSGSGKGIFSRKPSPSDPGETLGGLLAGGDFESSCRSRHEGVALRKPSPYKPSAHLVQSLREYEARHKKCGPHTFSFNQTAAALSKSRFAGPAVDCKYVLWTPAGGLGNRLISLASTFLYALLTGRVLLVDRGTDFAALMCEPFPGTSWLLPVDFPVSNMRSFGLGDALSYGSLFRNKKIRNEKKIPRAPSLSFVYLHLVSGYSLQDSFFFCEEDQLALREVPWLLLRSDNYFAPGLFSNALFEPELRFMFPEKEAVFHHLCRYLFHPSDKVWEMISDYYYSHLAQAAERVGIQIRVFDQAAAPFEVVLAQVVNCTRREKLLQDQQQSKKTRAVLVTSLYSGYLEGIQKAYAGNPEEYGLLSFHQPSSEKRQVKGDEGHDMKAWAEMNLLGFTDVLITTAQSTFGYVGQALAGVKPWVLVRPQYAKVPEPACVRDVSLEPCFHNPPNVCREKAGDSSNAVPYVAHCMDIPWGVKLVDRTA